MPRTTPFDAITSVDALRRAWGVVAERGGGPGGDGESIADFARGAELRLERLSRELRLGFYRPGPLRHYPLEKEAGGVRVLSIPCVADRVAQRAAADVLSRLLEPEFEDASFGYRPGRSVAQAVARVAALRERGYRWVVDGDIRCFFDEVPHGMILARLGALVPDTLTVQLVALWLEGFSADGKGLAQGSPVSPLLSNLHLDAVDEAMESGGVRLVRFADDFVILTRTQPKALAALDKMAELLAGHGLELNREKTRIAGFEDSFRFLGHLFVRSLVMPATETGEPRLWAGGYTSREAERALAPSLATAGAPPPAAPRPLLAPAAPRESWRPPPPEDGEEDLAAGLAPLYVLEPGRKLVAEGEAFAVWEDGRRLAAIPAHLAGRIDLGSRVEAADQALRLASAHRVPVHFLDGYGHVEAVLMPAGAARTEVHLAQARLSLDPAAALAHTRRLVAGRLRNAHALLKRLNRRRKLMGVETAADTLHGARRRAQHAASIDAARGYEGEGAAAYWPALGQCLEHGWLLTRRVREGEKDAVNAILDWTASLLARDVRAAVLRAGLHPGFGALHAPQDEREACVFDLIEEFRAPLAEGLTVYLFNNRVLTGDDFALRGREMRVAGDGGKKLIMTYESWLARPVKIPGAKRRTSWRGLILWQARALARAACERRDYEPYELDY